MRSQQTAWSPKISLGCVHIGQGSITEDARFEDSVVTILIGGDSDNKSTSMDLGRTGQAQELAFVRSSGEKPVVESFVDRKVAVRTAVQYQLGIPVIDPDATCPMCTAQ